MSKMFLTKGPHPRGSKLPRVEVTCAVCDVTVEVKTAPVGKYHCPICREKKGVNEFHSQEYK